MPDYEKLMAKARKTNKHRDGVERRIGCTTPGGGSLVTHLRTVLLAVECGIKLGDRDNVAEGQAMLEECIERARLLEAKPQNKN